MQATIQPPTCDISAVDKLLVIAAECSSSSSRGRAHETVSLVAICSTHKAYCALRQ